MYPINPDFATPKNTLVSTCRRKPGSYLKIHDWAVALTEPGRKRPRQKLLLSALIYRGRRGTTFERSLEELSTDTQGMEPRTIRRGMVDLERLRLIQYRSTGRGYRITLLQPLLDFMADQSGHEAQPIYKEVKPNKVCKKAVAVSVTEDTATVASELPIEQEPEQTAEIETALVNRAICQPVARRLARMYTYTVAVAILLAIDAIARRKTISAGMYVAAFRTPELYVPPPPPPPPPPPTPYELGWIAHMNTYDQWCIANGHTNSSTAIFLQYMEEHPYEPH